MKVFVSFSIVALALTVAATTSARAETAPMTDTMRAPSAQVTHLQKVALDDGRQGWIGSDHKLYLKDASGKSVPAPAGHYLLANGGCVTVAADATIDPASFKRLTVQAVKAQ